MRNYRLNSQRGVALITVLFMFTLLAIVLSGLIAVNSADINRAKSYFSSEQAYLFCLSGEEIARQMLAEDFKKSPDVDHVNEAWAKSGYIYNVDGGYFEVFIEDASGKFNVNNLSDANTNKQKMIFSGMLKFVIDEQSLADKVAEQMMDWVDTDKVVGTEEFDYLSEDPSYRPPNGAVADISEIRWLKDVDAEIYKAVLDELYPSLTALPAQNKININTIAPLVLAGLGNIKIEDAESFVKTIRSTESGFPTAAQAAAGIPGVDLSLLDVKSDYFQVRVRAKYGEHYAYLTSLIFRDSSANGRLEIISRDRSKKFVFPFSEDYNESLESGDYEIDI